jgi:hypothetical protein
MTGRGKLGGNPSSNASGSDDADIQLRVPSPDPPECNQSSTAVKPAVARLTLST